MRAALLAGKRCCFSGLHHSLKRNRGVVPRIITSTSGRQRPMQICEGVQNVHTTRVVFREEVEDDSSVPRDLQDIDSIGYVYNPNLRPFVRLDGSSDDHLRHQDTGFTVSFLGTGAGLSSIRSHTSTALRMPGSTFLFDAGEGTQKQLMMSRCHFRDIEAIFITHLHGDHIYGLPGLLLRLQLTAMSQNTPKTMKVYGPVGLYNFLAVSLSLSASTMKMLTVEVYELHGGSLPRKHPGGGVDLVEFSNDNLIRKAIFPNPDRTWTLMEATEVTSPQQALRTSPGRYRGMHVTAAEVLHDPKLQSFGYVVEEPRTQARTIDAEQLQTLGIAPSKKYQLLKWGFPVPVDGDASQIVTADEALVGDPPRPRKLAILGDSVKIPPTIARLCQGADILVHEATLLSKDKRSPRAFGHSAPEDAARLCNFVHPHVVALNHLSPTVVSNSAAMDRVTEARRNLKTPTEVVVTWDLMEILVPKSGFQLNTLALSNKSFRSLPHQPDRHNIPQSSSTPRTHTRKRKSSNS